MLVRELELLGVEGLVLGFVVEDGRVTTRVTVVVLAGLVLGVEACELEDVVVDGLEVVRPVLDVVVGLASVVGLAVVEGVVFAVTLEGVLLLVLPVGFAETE